MQDISVAFQNLNKPLYELCDEIERNMSSAAHGRYDFCPKECLEALDRASPSAGVFRHEPETHLPDSPSVLS